ncbi:YeeE/YedE thiosulfate transporter family protein [Planctomycetota bacterium]
MSDTQESKTSFMNPYLAGICLGLVLLASFIVLGVGLGASAGLARFGAWLQLCIAREATLSSPYFGRWGETPLKYYLVFMFVGTFIGGLFSALLARRIQPSLERAEGFPGILRAILAILGGVLVGFASRLASGCTSGQALTGMAQLVTGSFLFLICMFAGGYAAAFFVRRQWND